jgi:hypothetical protein
MAGYTIRPQAIGLLSGMLCLLAVLVSGCSSNNANQSSKAREQTSPAQACTSAATSIALKMAKAAEADPFGGMPAVQEEEQTYGTELSAFGDAVAYDVLRYAAEIGTSATGAAPQAGSQAKLALAQIKEDCYAKFAAQSQSTKAAVTTTTNVSQVNPEWVVEKGDKTTEVVLGDPQSVDIEKLTALLGQPISIKSSLCRGGSVPVSISQWNDLSLGVIGSKVVAIDYNYGGWQAAQSPPNTGLSPPPAGAILTPTVHDTSGVTVGQTAAHAQSLEPSLTMQAATTEYEGYMSTQAGSDVSSGIQFILPSADPSVISQMVSYAGNC